MDLIDREQAIKEIHFAFEARPEGHAQAVYAISRLPSAEKTGHWKNGENNIGMKRYVCSICGKGQPYLRFNYCPNCGAQMEE